MRRHCLAALSAVLLASPVPASANDSSAALSAGGLVLTKSADVRMASEDLYISTKEIRIRYSFVNDGPKDMETIVAFPLPDIATGEYYESPIGTMTDDPVNFVGFTVKESGRAIPVKVEQRAFFRGKDVTATLQGFHIPINIIHPNVIQSLDKVSPATRKALFAQGLAEGDKEYIAPRWTVRTKIYWTQKFPAGKSVTLEQRYQPVVGQTFFSEYEFDPKSEGYFIKTYCMDKPTQAAARKALEARKAAQSDMGELLFVNSVQYILKTAANWKGPIGDFHLTLDKGKPANILSLCFKGDLKRTAPTRFEFSAKNFAPKQDLDVLVLE